ncbi:MAG TPA: hypothetical protein VFC93_08410 [Chloroflexota bacterium]|nr:hypothetical protein [Chloroflexota bacterium]
MAQKTLAPNLVEEDKKVGVYVAVIGVCVALFISCTIYGLTLYNAAFYAR